MLKYSGNPAVVAVVGCGCSFSFRLAVCTALPVCFVRLAFFVRYIFGQDAHEVYAKQVDVVATVFMYCRASFQRRVCCS